MNDRPLPRQPDPAGGLCAACRHAQLVVNARGSRFVLCRQSRREPAFPKYPALPVLRCAGFEPVPPDT